MPKNFGDWRLCNDWTCYILLYIACAFMPVLFHSSWRALLSAACALGLLAGCAPSAQDGEKIPVILAASSLQEALSEAAEAYGGKGNDEPALSFASSAALARQIEYGAPADLFISADQQWMDVIEEGGHIAEKGRADLLANRLVLIAPISDNGRGLSADFSQIIGNLEAGSRIAIADPESVPAGRYVKALLRDLGVWEQLEDRLVPSQNVRSALALVERGEAEFGIVYASDAQASAAVYVAQEFPPELQPSITYPIAILDGGPSAQKDQLFAFLTSDEAARIFQSHGFGMAR